MAPNGCPYRGTSGRRPASGCGRRPPQILHSCVIPRLPVVSGAELIKALDKGGWQAVRQRGSQVRLKHPQRTNALVVPLHRELKRGTLDGILKDAGLSREELRRPLQRGGRYTTVIPRGAGKGRHGPDGAEPTRTAILASHGQESTKTSIRRGVEQRQLTWLITRRSRVRIPPPLGSIAGEQVETYRPCCIRRVERALQTNSGELVF
jgi:predicted RNA binding protein YcfA (HicA-like mRNA interferase family)